VAARSASTDRAQIDIFCRTPSAAMPWPRPRITMAIVEADRPEGPTYRGHRQGRQPRCDARGVGIVIGPGPENIAMMLRAADAFPMNLGFMGKGNASQPEALRQQVEAGAMGLKLHEDGGTTPAAIDCC
jgi:hypothetical protein